MLERNTTPPPGKITIQPKILVLIIVAIVVIAVLLTSFFVVDQTEQGVVLRFGHYNRIVGAGLQFKLPLGIEKNFNVPTQIIQTMSFGFRTEQSGVSSVFEQREYPEESVMLTGDLNIVDVEWVIQYKIDDPYAWLFNVQDRAATIRDISQSVINELVGDLQILSVMGESRTAIEVTSQQKMQAILDSYGLGIKIVTVKLKNIVPPYGEVQDAFEDVNKAIQDMERLINEGKELYNSDIPRARGEAAQLIQFAEGYASERTNESRGDVARFNAVREAYLESKEVTAKRLYIEAMEDILKSGNTTIIDKTLENFLPLQNLSTDTAGGLK
jgi:modulator of FtsH protease HflK